MNDSNQRRLIWLGATLAVALVLTALRVHAAPADASRYPYDPACAWGRVADGRGMLVRCLSEQEATTLAAAAPAADAGAPASPVAPATPPDAGATPAAVEPLIVTVGPVVADSGQLPLAEKKLAQPKDRYTQCVHKHGGLKANEGEVSIRFLVQAPRGRAEGVEVIKTRSIGMEAARCIADVIDRRAVGTPEAPLVAATVTIKLRKPTK